MYKNILLFASILFLAACMPVKKGAPIDRSEKKAFVIVALKGNMQITEARYCTFICSAWYSFADEKENGVHIFSKSVGSTFDINLLYSVEKRGSGLFSSTQPLAVGVEGKKIKITSPGVYYFGLFESVDKKLHYSSEPDPEILRQAKEKYGEELAKLTPIDFNWPEN